MFRATVLILFTLCFATCQGFGKNCTEAPCILNDTKSIRFFVIGDWGGTDKPPYVTLGQQLCANLSLSMGLEKKPHFFLGPGDNFYENGVTNTEDPRFKLTFDDVFLYGKDEMIPWYMVAGNHDWLGNVAAQIEYSQLNKRWVFPSYAYTTQYNAQPHGPSVDIIMIDTMILCGVVRDDASDNDTLQPGGPENLEWADSLWAWIEEQLANSTADYLFVVGHYPAFASDHHNVSDCLVPKLEDMLGKYNATAYISGHAHNLQHITTKSTTNRTIHHVISGGGHALTPNYKPFNMTDDPWHLSSEFFFPKELDGIKKYKKSKQSMGGFVYVDLGPKAGTTEYYKCDGTLLYSFQFEPRNF